MANEEQIIKLANDQLGYGAPTNVFFTWVQHLVGESGITYLVGTLGRFHTPAQAAEFRDGNPSLFSAAADGSDPFTLVVEVTHPARREYVAVSS